MQAIRKRKGTKARVMYVTPRQKTRLLELTSAKGFTTVSQYIEIHILPRLLEVTPYPDYAPRIMGVRSGFVAQRVCILPSPTQVWEGARRALNRAFQPQMRSVIDHVYEEYLHDVGEQFSPEVDPELAEK